jgi:hypothetical protein
MNDKNKPEIKETHSCQSCSRTSAVSTVFCSLNGAIYCADDICAENAVGEYLESLENRQTPLFL